MRYMLIVKATGYTEAGVRHSAEYHDARMAYRKTLAKAGVLLAAEELGPSSIGIRISYSSYNGEPEVEAGPFPINQELIAEFILINVKSEDEALAWAFRMPVPAGRGEYQIELRRLEEAPASLREPRILAMEADLQDQLDLLKKM